jgi:hypothetical protein
MKIEMIDGALTLDAEVLEDRTLQDAPAWEPICQECGEPIRWVLDMQSFKSIGGGRYVACHARCVWTAEGFRVQEKLVNGVKR